MLAITEAYGIGSQPKGSTNELAILSLNANGSRLASPLKTLARGNAKAHSFRWRN